MYTYIHIYLHIYIHMFTYVETLRFFTEMSKAGYWDISLRRNESCHFVPRRDIETLRRQRSIWDVRDECLDTWDTWSTSNETWDMEVMSPCHYVPRRDIETSQERDTCLSISHLTCLMCLTCQDIDVWRETHWDISRERHIKSFISDETWDMRHETWMNVSHMNDLMSCLMRHQCETQSRCLSRYSCLMWDTLRHLKGETRQDIHVSQSRCLWGHWDISGEGDTSRHWCLTWDTISVFIKPFMSHLTSLSLVMSQWDVSRQTSMSWHMRHVKWEIERHVSLFCDVSMSLLGTQWHVSLQRSEMSLCLSFWMSLHWDLTCLSLECDVSMKCLNRHQCLDTWDTWDTSSERSRDMCLSLAMSQWNVSIYIISTPKERDSSRHRDRRLSPITSHHISLTFEERDSSRHHDRCLSHITHVS